MRSVINLTLVQTYLTRSIALLAGVCTCAVFLYGTFLLLAVAHTAARSSAQKQISALVAQVGDLEMQYLNATKELTPQRASALGFVAPAPAQQTTMFATAAVQSLSLKR